jgi:hypothetical protein
MPELCGWESSRMPLAGSWISAATYFKKIHTSLNSAENAMTRKEYFSCFVYKSCLDKATVVYPK